MKSPVRVTIFCQYNPLASSAAGGIGALIRSCIRNAPAEFDFAVIGVSDDVRELPPLQWQTLALAGRPFRFLPLFHEDETARTLPLGVRFSLQVWHHRHRLDLAGRILHFHRPEPAVALRALAAPKFLFIHNTVGEAAGSLPQRLKHWSNDRLEDLAVPSVTQVYAVREAIAADFQRRYPSAARRIAFTPTWVDSDHCYPLPPARRLEQKERFLGGAQGRLIVFIGRLEAQKDLLLLLAVFERVHSHRPEVRLLVGGEGSLRPQLEKVIAERRLTGAVQLLGNVAYEQVPLLLAAADLLLLTSRYEGMPVAVLEALACGVPVVSTDVGEVRRVLAGGGGRLAAGRDAEEIAAVVEQVLEQLPTVEDCLRAVAPFTATHVLAPLYSQHRALQRTGRDITQSREVYQ